MTIPSRTHRAAGSPKVRLTRWSDLTVRGRSLTSLVVTLSLAAWGCTHAPASRPSGPGQAAYPIPVEASLTAPPPADPVVELALAYERSCARMTSGQVKCWGLGYDDAPRAWPTAIPGIAQAVQLAVGPTHACARLESGHLKCFGANESGGLGDGTREPALAATVDPGVESALDVAVGVDFTCARVAHEALCWGDNHRGSLGLGTLGEPSLRPVVVPSLSGALAMSLAGRHGLALVDSTAEPGVVLGWGDDAHALIGDTAAPKPAPIKLAGLLHVRELASSSAHACARFDSGTVACWGDNDAGQLGDGTNVDRRAPTPVLGLSNAVQIAVGERTSCARLASGAVSCWGANEHGQLGDGTTTTRSKAERVPGLGGVRQIAVGGTHACALLTSGEVQCWGRNAHGELGDRTTTSRGIRGPVLF